MKRNITYFFLVLFVAIVESVSAKSTDEFPAMVKDVRYLVSDDKLDINFVANLSDSAFVEFEHDTIGPNRDFWLKIRIDNRLATNNRIVLHFNNQIFYVYLYQKDGRGDWQQSVSGKYIPEKDKALKGYIDDKVLFELSKDSITTLYLNLRRDYSRFIDKSIIHFIDMDTFIRSYSRTKQIQSFFLGVVYVLCFFNLLFFLFTRTRIYFYYMLYALVSSVFFIYHFKPFERGFFVDQPFIYNWFFYSFIIAEFIYLLFLNEAIKDRINSKLRSRIQWVTAAILLLVLALIIVAIFNLSAGHFLTDIFTYVYSTVIVVLFFVLFPKSPNSVRCILIGSLFVLLGGCMSVITNVIDEIPDNVYWYQLGFIIELIFFTIAINFMHHNERLVRIKTELSNVELENEKLKQEAEARILQNELQEKECDLTSQTLAIAQKDRLIENLIHRLESFVEVEKIEVDDAKGIISKLDNKRNKKYWDEFNIHFLKIYPGFFDALNAKFDGLTNTDRRLCAFIKLNLSTLEIAEITNRNIESVYTSRSRLRKKLGLLKDDNIETIIADIN